MHLIEGSNSMNSLVLMCSEDQLQIHLAIRYRSGEIGNLNYRIALKFDRNIDSSIAEVPVKFQSDRTILNTNLMDSGLCESLQ